MQRSRKHLLSQAGNAMTTSLMVTGGAAAISAFLFAQSISTDRATKLPRIKSAMNQVEVSLRSLVLQPSSFTCAQVGATDKANCTINLAGLNFLERELPGEDAGSRCKIAIQNAGIGTAGNATVNGAPFVATLKYTCSSDKDAERVAAQKISIDIPGEITTVTSNTFTCADIDINKPILVGFNSTSGAGSSGGIKCVSMKSSCAANEYVTSIDQATMKVTCSPIPSAALAESSANMLGGIIWKGSNITAGPPVARKNPSSLAALGPMFVTSPSSSKATVLAKPSAVATGGACTCDSGLTSCWDGSSVCASAGESCPALPPSPTPSSPSPTPIVSVTPTPTPTPTGSNPCDWYFDGAFPVPSSTQICAGATTPKPTTTCDASIEGTHANECLDAGKGNCANGTCSDGFGWFCSCSGAPKLTPASTPTPTPTPTPAVLGQCGPIIQWANGSTGEVGGACGASASAAGNGDNGGPGAPITITNTEAGFTGSVTARCMDSDPLKGTTAWEWVISNATCSAVNYGCASVKVPQPTCFQQVTPNCIAGTDIASIANNGCLNAPNVATNVQYPPSCGATTSCWLSWDCPASPSGGTVSCSAGIKPKATAWMSAGIWCEYCTGSPAPIPFNICGSISAGMACTKTGSPPLDTCKMDKGAHNPPPGQNYEIFKCQ